MIARLSKGNDTRALLKYLYGPGRVDEHTDAHLVAAWNLAVAPDPGRHTDTTLTVLARHLDAYVTMSAHERGTKPPNHVWHCSLRGAPQDPHLDDATWAHIARRLVAATGIDPDGDTRACRWIAVRHADDHIHIVATTARLDGRSAKCYRDILRAREQCRALEEELGLRRLDGEARPPGSMPTIAELHKARRLGHDTTTRERLCAAAREALDGAGDENEYFARLTTAGVLVHRRIAPDGEVQGYALAFPDDTNTQGQPIRFSGRTLARDLSLPRVREHCATA